MTNDADDHEGAWSLTVAELRRMAEELEADGWEVAALPAGHVAPESPGAGDTDRFGLVHVVPGDGADAFERAFEAGGFTEYEVFRRLVGNRLFLLTKLTAPGERVAILLAGSVDLTQADPLAEAAAERGELYSHVQLLDGTHLGSFHHGDPSLFFPALDADGG